MLFSLESLLLLHASFPGAHRVCPFGASSGGMRPTGAIGGAFWSIRGAPGLFWSSLRWEALVGSPLGPGRGLFDLASPNRQNPLLFPLRTKINRGAEFVDSCINNAIWKYAKNMWVIYTFIHISSWSGLASLWPLLDLKEISIGCSKIQSLNVSRSLRTQSTWAEAFLSLGHAAVLRHSNCNYFQCNKTALLNMPKAGYSHCRRQVTWLCSRDDEFTLRQQSLQVWGQIRLLFCAPPSQGGLSSDTYHLFNGTTICLLTGTKPCSDLVSFALNLQSVSINVVY